MATIVDAHAHVISDDLITYPVTEQGRTWLTSAGAEPAPAEKLLRLMDENAVERAVIVQRFHVYGWDNSYVMDVAARYPDRLVPVCCVNPNAPDVGERLDDLADRGAAAFRLIALDINERLPDVSWLADESSTGLWESAEKRGLGACVHLFEWNREPGLLALEDLLASFPTVRVVLDHLSSPPPAAGPPAFGLEQLEQLARYPNLYLKISTINLVRLQRATVDASAFLRRATDAFGADRIMWGSDFAQTPGRYGDLMQLFETAIASDLFSDEERRWVRAGTAEHVYGSSMTADA